MTKPSAGPPPKIKIKALPKSQKQPKSPMEEAMASEAPIEEHFILRLPPKLAQRLEGPIKKREVPEDLSFSFNGILD